MDSLGFEPEEDVPGMRPRCSRVASLPARLSEASLRSASRRSAVPGLRLPGLKPSSNIATSWLANRSHTASLEAGDRSPTLTAYEARRLADELERAAELEDGLDDDLRGLIEWLRDCADVLNGKMSKGELGVSWGGKEGLTAKSAKM